MPPDSPKKDASPFISDAGLPGDHDAFKVLVEVEIIAKLIDQKFGMFLPPLMTRAQFGVLNRLARLEARETISDLAAAFGVSQPTMSSTIKKLLGKSFVKVAKNDVDARRKIILLTPAGAKVRAETIARLEPVFDHIQIREGQLDWPSLLRQLTILRQEMDARISLPE